MRVLDNPMLRNIALLATCQALSMTCLSMMMTIAAIVGTSLAPDPSLGTLPLALQFVAVMLTTLPASLLMKHYGRQFGFVVGACAGIAGGLVSAHAVMTADFVLLCAGGMLVGAFSGFSMYYRFAAVDTAGVEYRSRAISWVLAGGVVAAVAGPEIAKHTRDLLAPVLFAGSYLAVAAIAALSLVFIAALRIPKPSSGESHEQGRPLGELLRQPKLLLAVASGMVGYGAMNLIMVSTPMSMLDCGHSFEIAATVIQAHVLGMYLPSFVTGDLIKRFGIYRILVAGGVLVMACVAVNVDGVTSAHFGIALVLLGLGWNFLYIGGSTLLTETYRTAEKAKVQALNEFSVFGTTAVTALSSAAITASLGWAAVNLVTLLPLVLVVCGALLLFQRSRRPQPA